MRESSSDTQIPSGQPRGVEAVGLRGLEPALCLIAYCVLGLASVWWSGSLRNAVLLLIATLPGAVALADCLLALSRAQQMLSGWQEDSARENLARPRTTLNAPHPAATGIYQALPDRLLSGVRVSTISTFIGALLLAAVFGVVGVWSGGDVALVGKPVWKIALPESAAAAAPANAAKKPTEAAAGDLCSCAANSCPKADCLLPTWASQQPTAGQATAKTTTSGGGAGAAPANDAMVGLSLGLLGGYLATLFSLLLRLRAGAVTGKFLLMCALRAAIGAVIGFSAATTAALAPDGMTSRTVYLLLGMFPNWAYQYLRRKAAELLQASRPGTEPLPLDLVAGLDDGIIDRLAEMGTWDVQHLATSRPVELAIKTLYPLAQGR